MQPSHHFVGRRNKEDFVRCVGLGAHPALTAIEPAKVNFLLISEIANMPEQPRHLANKYEDIVIVNLQGGGGCGGLPHSLLHFS